MRGRLPLLLSVGAMLVAILGATPLGEAARNAVLPPHSVGTKQLRNGSVGTAQLKANAVTSAKVLNGSLLGIDFKPGQLVAGAPGPAGPKGEKGDAGPKGDPGPRGAAWSDVNGPGTSGGTYTAQGFSVTLPTNVGRRGTELKFLVFGKIDVELTCSSAGACGLSYILMVNDTPLPLSGLSFSGKAGEKTRDHGTAFAIATVRSTGIAGGAIATPPTKLQWGFRKGSNLVEFSTGTTVGAIALG